MISMPLPEHAHMYRMLVVSLSQISWGKQVSVPFLKHLEQVFSVYTQQQISY